MGLDLGLELLLLSSFLKYELLMFSCGLLMSRAAMSCGTSPGERVGRGAVFLSLLEESGSQT